MNNNSRALFFLTLSLICIWLILDNFLGNHYINNFLEKMFDFMGGNSNGGDMDGDGQKETVVKEQTDTLKQSQGLKPSGQTSFKDENGNELTGEEREKAEKYSDQFHQWQYEQGVRPLA